MKSLTKAARVNTALQVIQHMNDGMKVVDACKEVGIPRSTFYYICQNNPEVIAEYQEMVEANSKKQLGLILLSKTQILQRVIEDGLSDDTAPRDRLAIYKTLSELEGALNHSLQLESEAAREAHEFLKRGPTTSHKVSRLTAAQTMITVESES